MKKLYSAFVFVLFFYYSQSQQYNSSPLVDGDKCVSIHQEQSEYYKSLGLTTDAQFDSLNGFKGKMPSKPKQACTLNKIVYGWHPYWSGSTYLNYQWNLLTDFSYFSYEVDPSTGNAITTHNWLTADAVDSAIANGVRVNLCVTLFSSHTTFFASSTAQQTLIDNLINLVQQRGANGVCIDFESVPSLLKDNLTNFLISLCNQMHSAIPGSQISIALPAVDWGPTFDIPVLNNYIDLFCIMGYAYYYSGSSQAGPTDPLYTFTSSYNYNLSKSVTYYLHAGASPEKLVLGLPYYGYEWPTVSNTVPSNTLDNGYSRTYKTVRNNASGYYSASNKHWEGNSFIPYYVYNNSGWYQCFINDDFSLGKRFDLVNNRAIAGIAIWALGYDDGYTEFWDMLREKFTDCGTVPCCDTIYDMGGPAFNYYNNEQYTYTIAPTGATSLTLTFNSFELEAGYDSLWLYDGPNTSSPLIGGYSGTTSPGVISSSGTSLTLKFYSDGATTKPGWAAIWQCTADNIPPTTLISADNWETDDFTATFTDTDNDTITAKLYQVLDYNGTEWRANGNNGFFNDNFQNVINPEWTNIAGTWSINSARLNQTDETSSNTNLYAMVNQQSGNVYLYHWQMNIGGSGTNRRAGMHFFCDDATQSNRNNSYFVYFRVDNDKCQIYKCINNVYTLETNDNCTVDPNTWYDCKVLFNTVTGEIKAYLNNAIVSSWIDTSPYLAGNSISLRTGNCNVLYDDVKVYKSRSDNVIITVGTDSTADVRYNNPNPLTPACRIKSVIIDNANNFSNIGNANVNIDWTQPADIFVNDGISADIDTSSSITSLSANWTSSTDINSGITEYWFTVDTIAGDSGVINWTNNNMDTTAILNGLNLDYGKTYYFSVKARNGAGLFSNITSSDGVLIKPAVMADFSASDTVICSGETISFTNNSINADTYEWTFDGGNPPVSSAENPVVMYDSAGVFSVNLIVSNIYGSDTSIKTITVEQSSIADFIANTTTGEAPLLVLFTNTSSYATTYYWNFGDGAVSNDINPYHFYTDTGNYTVTLIACNALCPCDTIIKDDYIYVQGIIGIEEEVGNGTSLQVYPNPLYDKVILLITNTEYRIQNSELSLYDVIGREIAVIYKGKLENGTERFELNLADYSDGVYYLCFYVDGLTNKAVKLVKITPNR